MRLPLYQIDAFAAKPFRGNPAAICPLDRWIDDGLMQAIAAENNLAETAFFVAEGGDYRLRWFTPTVEVDLCGHATLASGWLLLNRLAPERGEIVFHTRSGPLGVRRGDGRLMTMDLPSRPAQPVDPCSGLIEAMGGASPSAILAARDYLLVYDNEAQVRALKPDMAALIETDCFAVCATAPGDDGHDFVSRFFAPAQGIPEDPVTGSAHCTLAPFWAKRLGKSELKAYQASARGGELLVADRGERVELAGQCALYLEGFIHV